MKMDLFMNRLQKAPLFDQKLLGMRRARKVTSIF